MATTDTQLSASAPRASRPEAGLRRTLTVLRRRGWVVLLCVVIAGGAAFGLSRAQTKQYTATSSLLFNNENVSEQVAGVTGTAVNDPTGQRATNLLLVQLANVSVSRAASAELGGQVGPGQIRSAVTAAQAGQSNIVSISATGPDPRLAARIADAYTRAFAIQQRQSDQATVQNGISLVQQQFNSLTKTQQGEPQGQALLDRIEALKVVKSVQNNTQVIQRAQVPTSPSSPRVARNVTLGVVLGLLVGLVLAFQRDSFDQRLRDPADVEGALDLPMLGVIPHGSGRPMDQHDGWAIDLEPFRMLRAHLRYFNIDRDVRTLLVISPLSAEGKTTVAHGLAAAAANAGDRTLLIEADLRAPVMEQSLNLPPGVGLTGALISNHRIGEAIQQVHIESSANGNTPGHVLDVLPAGAAPPNPAEMLESNAMQHVLRWAREHYDFVVVDSAPLALVPDAIPLMGRVDGVIVVSRLGRSTRDAAERLRERLASLEAPLLGVVINDIRSRRGTYGYGDYSDGRYVTDSSTTVRGARIPG